MAKEQGVSEKRLADADRVAAIFSNLPQDQRAWIRLLGELPEDIAQRILTDIDEDPGLQGYIPADCPDQAFLRGVLCGMQKA